MQGATKRHTEDEGDKAHGKVTSQWYLRVNSVRFQAIRRKAASISEQQEQRADSGKEMHSSNNRKKARVTMEDSDNSGDKSNVLVEEINTASNTDDKVYLDCACNKMIFTLRRISSESTKI